LGGNDVGRNAGAVDIITIKRLQCVDSRMTPTSGYVASPTLSQQNQYQLMACIVFSNIGTYSMDKMLKKVLMMKSQPYTTYGSRTNATQVLESVFV
jgi:hypothetical protein